MRSKLKPEKREKAFEWIAQRIIAGAKNCSTAIIKIHTICQNPEKFNDPNRLIETWLKHLFTSELHSSYEDWTSNKNTTPKTRATIEYFFFSLCISYIPILFLDKKLNLTKLKEKKWTNKDFQDLRLTIMKYWFEEEFFEYENNDLPIPKSLENKVKEIMSITSAVAKAQKKLFTNESRLEFLLSTSPLELKIKEILPKFEHSYQSDLYELYSQNFIRRIPNSLLDMRFDFYEKGNYLHHFFKEN